jgi:hypothetical protein
MDTRALWVAGLVGVIGLAARASSSTDTDPPPSESAETAPRPVVRRSHVELHPLPALWPASDVVEDAEELPHDVPDEVANEVADDVEDAGVPEAVAASAIQGRVVDSESAEEVAGVTVVVTSPSIAGSQIAITDEKGAYKIVSLSKGEYVVTLYYVDLVVVHAGVSVGERDTRTLFDSMDLKTANDVTGITFSGAALVDDEYTHNIPTDRTFEAVLGSAADLHIEDGEDGAHDGIEVEQ